MSKQSDRIERAFRLGYPIDDAVKRAVLLAKGNQLWLDAKNGNATTSTTHNQTATISQITDK